jgi:hypothetical protein
VILQLAASNWSKEKDGMKDGELLRVLLVGVAAAAVVVRLHLTCRDLLGSVERCGSPS